MGLIHWAWKFPGGPAGLKPNEKLMLVAVADDADKETGECRTRIQTLANDAACGIRQAQRLLRVLERDLDLLHSRERNPGSGDGLRVLYAHTHIDPLEWVRPGRRRTVMSTSDFQKVLREAFTRAHQNEPDFFPTLRSYDIWVPNLRIGSVQKARLKCFVPSSAHGNKIYDQYAPFIIEVAQHAISPAIQKLVLIWPKERSKKLTN